jgi:hypothetical protein
VAAARIGGDDEAERRRCGWGEAAVTRVGEDAAARVGAAARVRCESRRIFPRGVLDWVGLGGRRQAHWWE